MSNVYDKAIAKFGNGDLSWRDHEIRAVLVDINSATTRGAFYVVDFAAHEFLSDIPSAARVSTSAALAGKSIAAAAFDIDDPVFTAVPTGGKCGAVVFFRNTGTASTSPLISYHDQGADLPLTPNGGNLTIRVSNGVDKLFRL